MRLLCFTERREGKGRKEKRCHPLREAMKNLHTVVYVYVYELAGTGQANIIFQAFHAITA